MASHSAPREPRARLCALCPVATLATVVLEFLCYQFLFWLVVLPRLLAHVSPKGESLFLEEEGEWDAAPKTPLLLTLCTCSWDV